MAPPAAIDAEESNGFHHDSIREEKRPQWRPASTVLRQLLADSSRTIVAPGVYDGLTARIALREGFECLYMVGSIRLSLESRHLLPGRMQRDIEECI